MVGYAGALSPPYIAALAPVALFQLDLDGISDLLLTDWKTYYYYLPSKKQTSAVTYYEWSILK